MKNKLFFYSSMIITSALAFIGRAEAKPYDYNNNYNYDGYYRVNPTEQEARQCKGGRCPAMSPQGLDARAYPGYNQEYRYGENYCKPGVQGCPNGPASQRSEGMMGNDGQMREEMMRNDGQMKEEMMGNSGQMREEYYEMMQQEPKNDQKMNKSRRYGFSNRQAQKDTRKAQDTRRADRRDKKCPGYDEAKQGFVEGRRYGWDNSNYSHKENIPSQSGKNPGYGYGNNQSSMRYEESNADSMMQRPLMGESTERFKGVIKKINRIQSPEGTQIQVVLDTEEQGSQKIVLGPANFIDQNKVKLRIGDKLTVSGFSVTVNGERMIVAAEVKKNGQTIQLRNDNRQPRWNYRSYGNAGSSYRYDNNNNNGMMPSYRYGKNGMMNY